MKILENFSIENIKKEVEDDNIYKLIFPPKSYIDSYAKIVKDAKFIKESENIDKRLFSETYREIKLLRYFKYKFTVLRYF